MHLLLLCFLQVLLFAVEKFQLLWKQSLLLCLFLDVVEFLLSGFLLWLVFCQIYVLLSSCRSAFFLLVSFFFYLLLLHFFFVVFLSLLVCLPSSSAFLLILCFSFCLSSFSSFYILLQHRFFFFSTEDFTSHFITVIPLPKKQNQSYKPTCSAGIPMSLCNYILATIGDQQSRHQNKETSNYSQDVLQKPLHTEVALTKTRSRRWFDEA